MLTFTIPGDPKTKKNSQQLIKARGRTIPIQSKKYLEYEAACRKFLPIQTEPIDYPVNIKALFFRDTRRIVDRVGLEQALYDILVKYGILLDDNRDIVAGGDGSRVYYDKINPRTEVTITPMEEYEQWKKK